MAISSNCLFHFTDNIEKLYGILKNNFRPHFCYESIFKTLNRDYKIDDGYSIPMVCFCDLPLSLIHEHLSVYGPYGIGLKKDWGIKKGLNPIIYVTGESYINFLLKQMESNVKSILTDYNKSGNPALSLIYELYGFVKPYEGFSHKTKNNKIFYNEREWRYIPEIVRDNVKGIIYRLTNKEIADFGAEDPNTIIGIKYPLEFCPEDIKYIIIQDESEIKDLRDKIFDFKSNKYPDSQIDVLTTKFITVDKIIEDF